MPPVRHHRMRRTIEAYVDGEIRSTARVMELEAHLNQCWSCSGDAEVTMLLKRSLRRLGDGRPIDLATARLRRWAERLAP